MKPPFESRCIDLATNRIPHILRLLGPALLLPWPAGCKASQRKWKHLQLTEMSVPSHLAKLERAGNVGVALGQVSNGLVTIDLDKNEYVDAFLAVNPLLMETLRTRAARGCNIWVRCNGAHPPSQRLKNAFGMEIGEWRADGNQTIISGTHPDGVPYQFVVEKPPITISYGAIIWPTLILPPRATESNRVRRVREEEVVGRLVVVACPELLERFSSQNLITQVAPTGHRQNNTSLFKLARLVRTYEGVMGRPATEVELEFVFDRWCLVARPFWRHTRDDYWAEFLQAYYYARIGLDQDPLELALNRAGAVPLSKVTGFSDERVKLLAGICSEMQPIVGNNSFFLPTRKLGTLLGAHWSTVARWLVALEALGIIHLAPGEVRRRGGNRSPRYRYGPAMQSTVGFSSLKQAVSSTKLLTSTNVAGEAVRPN